MAHDGREWRRVVPARNPVHVLELPTIAALVEAGALVVCGGGGGVPVCSEGDGFGGVDALVDSDLTSSLLAVELDADRLMLLTDVGEVRAGFGTAEERPLRRITLRELATMSFDATTMGSKVAAAGRFVAATGRPAMVGALGDAVAVSVGRAGTVITAC